MKIAFSKARSVGTISGTTITASSEDPAYPATNLLLGRVAKVWRSVAAAAPIATRTLTIAVPAGITSALAVIGCTAKSIAYSIMNTAESVLYFSGLIDLHQTTYSQVNMTAAASGSSGIAVADNVNLDMETNNCSFPITASIPDWTPSANVILRQKWASNVGFKIEIVATTGIIRLTLNTTVYNSSIAPGFADGSEHQITPVVTVGAVNTTVDFYIDGVLLGTQQTASNPGTISNAEIEYIIGTSAVRSAGACSFSATYNRALTAAEVLALYVDDEVADADKYGSQTELIATTNDRTFAGANNWVNSNFNSFNSTTDLTLSANANNQFCQLLAVNAPMTLNKKYRVSFGVSNLSGTFKIYDATGSFLICSVTGNGSNVFEFLVSDGTGGFWITNGTSTNASGDFDNFSLVKIGATLALEPEGIHKDKWYDSSTNALDATYPAAGATITQSGDSDYDDPVIVPDTSAEPSWNRAWIDWTNNSQALHIILTLYAHPTATYHEVGEIVVCETVDLPDPLAGLSESQENLQITQKLAGGGFYIHDGSMPRTFELSFILDRPAEYRDLRQLYSIMGMKPMAMLLSETQGDNEYCGYFHITSQPKAAHNNPTKSLVTLSLREAV